MGYYAETVDNDFTIPAENVAAALEALRAEYVADAAALEALRAASDDSRDQTALADLVEEVTSFQDCEQCPDGGFSLGYHNDKYVTNTEKVLGILSPFATEGSYVRFTGEDSSLFGFQVREGQLRAESGRYEWSLDE